jgi:hypothetical protein
MPGEDWGEKVKQYRVAVHAYCDAVDQMESTTDSGQEWQQIEAAREVAERARMALLRQRPKSAYVPIRAYSELSDLATEEWVLGDVGQHGG